jgi:L-asparaginase
MGGPNKLRVIATGGTIDKVYFDAKSRYEVGEPMVASMFEESEVAFGYEVVSLMKKDSLELTDADRAEIRAAVIAAPERHILVTHGTDTMPETARALAGIPDKVVVLTGGLYPARFRWTDAIFNVGGAVAAVWTLPAGVWVVVNGRVYAGDKVRKDRARNRFEELP